MIKSQPPDLAADIRRLEQRLEQLDTQRRQFEAQVQEDPQVSISLIQVDEQILELLKSDDDSNYYAAIQNSLGEAYRRLTIGDRATNLTQAITHYQEALRFDTPETLSYAMTQNNLGAAYRELPTGDRAANLAQAIAYYREALRFFTSKTDPYNCALIQKNLGTVYRSMFTGDRAANVTQAIAYYLEALRFLTPETDPLEYATTQNNLGLAYSELPTGDHAANLAQAIVCYQKALRFLTPKTTPFYYAMTQLNLGNAYSELPTGDRAANLALACYQKALRFLTPETAPFEWREVNHNLANLHFTRGEWRAALSAYRAAIDGGERLYRAGLSSESKATEATESTALYRYAAFTAVRCGETSEALLILERGKTRLLTEALRLRVSRPAGVPDETWTAFERAAAAVRAAQSERTIIATSSEERDPIQAYAIREQGVQAASVTLDAAIEKVREHAPDFLRMIDPSAVQALLTNKHTVLVAFCIIEQGSLGFVVTNRHDQDVQVAEIPTFTQTDLHPLFVEWDAAGRAVGGWLGAYDHYLIEQTQAAFDAWQETITDILAELSQRLLAPILSTLPLGVKRIIFLPSAELFLFPLHAAPLSVSGSERVCDRYQVSYAPSIEVLVDTRAKAIRDATPDLYIVVNPTADPGLPFTQIEGMAIARFFAQQRIDEGRRAGTKQHVIDGVHGRSYVHFSCHGSYNWDDPTASGLELADSRLTLAELQQGAVDLSAARLVTLSACETGITDVVQGSPEEYVGVPAGFLLAGVPCVVSSLWEVPDLSTALLMERFYRNHLNDDMDFAAALREAQVWVRELSVGEVAVYAEQCYRQARQKEQPEIFRLMRYYRHQAKQNPALRPFAHPYYWAAFTVNGL